jgi:cell division protein FtsA
MEEIFKMVKQHLDTLNLPRPLGGGVVLTGGGAMLSGVTELAHNVLKLPARLGCPIPTSGLEGLVEEYRIPSYATAVGLALEGDRRSAAEGAENGFDSRQGEKKNPALIEKLKSWLKEEFF